MRLIVLLLIAAACSRAGTTPTASPDTARHGTESAALPPGATLRKSRGFAKDLADTKSFFESRPVYEQPPDWGLSPIEGIGDNHSAKVCGTCHQAIAAEWALSTHRHAWNDPQFQGEMTKSGNTWLCRNCHTPTLRAQPYWPVGLTDDDVERPILVENKKHDPSLMDEGITCVACHVRDGIVHGPGLEDSTSPHAVVADTAYRSGQLCLRCHQAIAEYPGKTFVCTFNTGIEWENSPQAQAGQTCVTCHMPTVERPVAVGGPVRTVRHHWFKGSGIPKFSDQAPPPDAQPGPGLDLAATPAPTGVALRLTNAGSGHMLPSGDPERWIQVDVRFSDAAGAAVGEAWSTRIGQTWTWYPKPEKTADNRLAPGESRTLEVESPPAATSATVIATSHRMSSENAAYHKLGDDYPLSIQTHRVVVPLPPR